MAGKVDVLEQLEAAYQACTIGGRPPNHAYMSGALILEMQPSLRKYVEKDQYYLLARDERGQVSLTKV